MKRLVTSPTGLTQARPVVPSTEHKELVTCWNQIGVFGDKSCAELRTYVHCHHCPVHYEAGLQLLNRALPAGYRQERTEYFAQQHGAREASTFSVILFRLGREWLGLPTAVFHEVAEPKTIHSLPHCRGKVLGLANVRGELVICFSLAHLLGILNDSTGRRSTFPVCYHRLLVLQLEGGRLAFPVEEVQGPHRFHGDELTGIGGKISKPGRAGPEGVLRWQDRAVSLLDPARLLGAFKRNLR